MIVVEGTPQRLVARKKDSVAGLWINRDSVSFSGVPSYYAIVSTRPVDEIGEADVLKANEIGFGYVKMEVEKGP